MSNTVIRVENVSKKYKLGSIGTGTITQDLNRWWARLRGKEDPTRRIGEDGELTGEHWALRDVSFDIKQGEAVGIIGKNGAGKSTLLKILSRTTTPTSGHIKIKGRIASLLEVGTGFHPDLTGRENVFMNGAILGMHKAEIKAKFDEIVAFSGVEKYIDTPVKRYSSGMYVRLAFAVAAHLESEILILDEVLAVGDAEFQKKCLGKMGDVATKEGRTVIFVSHNMGAVSMLTSYAIFLQKGVVKLNGNTSNVVQAYLNLNIDKAANEIKRDISYFRRDVTNDTSVIIKDITINSNVLKLAKLKMEEAVYIKIDIEVFRKIHGANLSITVKNAQSDKVAILFSWDKGYYLNFSEGVHSLMVSMQNNLTPGNYFIDVGINQATTTKAYDVITDFPAFTVVNDGVVIQWQERPWGLIHYNNVKWELINQQITTF